MFLATVLAHLGHVAGDHFRNRLPRFSYSIVYRAIKKFDPAVIMPHQDVLDSYRSWPRKFPFGRRLEPWFLRRIEPWFLERVNRSRVGDGG
jgi:hypothetical protein